MHKLPHNQPTVGWKWIKFIQFKQADFLAAPHHAHLCSEHFSECDFANPMEYCMSIEADMLFWYSLKILPDRLKLIQLYPCGSLRQSISFVFRAQVGHFAATPQSDIVGIWSCDLGVMATLSVQQKMPFFHAFITLRTQFHLHHHSQRALMEIVSKITPNLGLVLKRVAITVTQSAPQPNIPGSHYLLMPSLLLSSFHFWVSIQLQHSEDSWCF